MFANFNLDIGKIETRERPWNFCFRGREGKEILVKYTFTSTFVSSSFRGI